MNLRRLPKTIAFERFITIDSGTRMKTLTTISCSTMDPKTSYSQELSFTIVMEDEQTLTFWNSKNLFNQALYLVMGSVLGQG